MRNSLSTGAVSACAAGTLLLSLALAPAVAHTPYTRMGIGPGHFAPHGLRGFNRIGVSRFGLNRFGLDRFGRNANALDFGLLGFDGSGYWAYPPSYLTAPAAPIIEGGPPVAINVYSGDGGAAGRGACPLVHLLDYDKAGHYVGERQIPAC